jgi:hypothetical protein
MRVAEVHQSFSKEAFSQDRLIAVKSTEPYLT